MFKENIAILIVIEFIKSFRYRLLNSIYFIATIVEFILPYVMLEIGYNLYADRGGVYFGSELLLPIIVLALTAFIKEYAKRRGMADDIPVPSERFTEVDEDGNVRMETNKYMEMMIYVSEVEDYLERHGRL